VSSAPDAARNPGSVGEQTAGAVPSGAAPAVISGLPKRVVLDTNVLVSLYVFADSRFAPLRLRVQSGSWQAQTRDDCLDEFRRVLAYPQFRLDMETQLHALADYRGCASILRRQASPDQVPLPRCKDRDDQKFLELARDGNAELLVTADKALLKLARRERLAGLFRILTPQAALAIA
jgi:putative PIN family toxin of toxin-antitoxin system